jgi:hypothetical protein
MAYQNHNLLTFDGSKQVRVPTNAATVIFKGLQVTDTPSANSDVATVQFVNSAIGAVSPVGYLKADGTIAMTGALQGGNQNLGTSASPFDISYLGSLRGGGSTISSLDVPGRNLLGGAGTTALNWSDATSIISSRNIIANLTATKDLGSATVTWANLYAGAAHVDSIGTVAGTGSISVTNAIDMASNKITSLATPVAGTDAANKDYVDTGVATAANKTLSNLTAPTSINAALIPATTGNIDLGTSAKNWGKIYTLGLVNAAGVVRLDYAGAYDTTGVAAVTFGVRQLKNSTGVATADWENKTLGAGAVTVLDWTSGALNDSTGAASVDASARNLIASTGLTMIDYSTAGVINASTNKISNVVDPVAAQDAATQNYVITQGALKVTKAGDTMSGNLNMGTNKVTGLGAPSAATDAVTKAYADALVSSGSVFYDPVNDPDLIDDTLSTPPVSPVVGNVYIVGALAAGAWAGLEGHAVLWSGSAWVDLLGRAIIAGDRFGVSVESATVAAGGLAGKDNQIAVVLSPTPGLVTYTFTVPTAGKAFYVSNQVSTHFGHSYNFNGTSWVEFGGPGATNAGTGLSWSGNTLNVNLGAGVAELPTDEVGIDVHVSGGLMTTVDNSVESTATAAQLAIKLDGATISKSSSGIKVANASLSDTQMAANGISGASIRLLNNQFLNAENSTPGTSVPLFKLSITNQLQLVKNNGSVAVNVQSGELIDASGVTSILWDGRTFYDTSNIASGDWGARVLADVGGGTSLAWGSRLGRSSDASISMNWENRRLMSVNGGFIALDWACAANMLETTSYGLRRVDEGSGISVKSATMTGPGAAGGVSLIAGDSFDSSTLDSGGDITLQAGSSPVAGNGGNVLINPGLGANVTGKVIVSASVEPSVNNVSNLGSSTNNWNSVWAGVVNATNHQVKNSNAQNIIKLHMLATPSGFSMPGLQGPNTGALDPATTAPYLGFAVVTQDDINTDAVKTLDINIETGHKNAGTGNSGNINLTTGSSFGGVRGTVSIEALALDLNGNNIINVPDPLAAQNAATKNYVDVVQFALPLVNNDVANIALNDFVYINSSGNVKRVIADGTITSLGDSTQFGVSRSASTAPASTLNVSVKSGEIIGGFSGLTVNSPIYASRTAIGGYQQNLTGFVTGDQVIKLGRVISATQLHFSPSFEFVY